MSARNGANSRGNEIMIPTSEAGTWSMQEIAKWQREAGLVPRKPIRLLTAPGARLQAALKPNSKGENGYGVLRKECAKM